MKKFFAMLILTLTFAAIAGAEPPCMPLPGCLPCSNSGN
jgi:hypothetical protein